MPDPAIKTTGSFYSVMDPPRPKDLPYRPPEQELGARLPPPMALPKNLYVDQLDNGVAHMVDDQRRAFDVPATRGMQEGHMMDGSLPDDHGEAAAIRHRLSAGDDGHSPISLEDVGNALPKVPLAPGSPGPPIPPAADSMIGVKKRSSDNKRRRIP